MNGGSGISLELRSALGKLQPMHGPHSACLPLWCTKLCRNTDVHVFTRCLPLLCSCRSDRMSRCDRDRVAHEAENIYSQALRSPCLPILTLKGGKEAMHGRPLSPKGAASTVQTILAAELALVGTSSSPRTVPA